MNREDYELLLFEQALCAISFVVHAITGLAIFGIIVAMAIDLALN